MISILFITITVVALGVILYFAKQFLESQYTEKEWYNTGMSDAAEGLPYNPPTNPFSARYYRQGYYPIKNRYR